MFGLRPKKAASRILVVEDDWDILEVLKLMLEYEGHQVVTAKHGREALAAAAAASKPFDLVVLDMSMPEMSGIEVAQALRSSPKTSDVYIVVHTGLDEHWVSERFADYDVFLTKAADAEVLVEQIARLLAQPRAADGRRIGRTVSLEFTSEDVVVAQKALRLSLGLAPKPLSKAAFVDALHDEIDQLRRVGRSDAEIAALLSSALGRTIGADAIEAHRR